MADMINSPTIAHPIPIPALAPVLSPPLAFESFDEEVEEVDVDDDVAEEAELLDDEAAPVTASSGTVYVALNRLGAGAERISSVG